MDSHSSLLLGRKRYSEYNPHYFRRKIRKIVASRHASENCDSHYEADESQSTVVVPLPLAESSRNNTSVPLPLAELSHDNVVVRPPFDSTSAGIEFFPSIESDAEFRAKILKNLKQWIENHQPSQSAVRDLVTTVIRPIMKDDTFPCDKRTIFKVTRKKIDVENMEPGFFYYFGIQNQLQIYENLPEGDEIELMIGIDGVPITKSSRAQFWPILSYVYPNQQDVFVVGLYYGKAKPLDVNYYLEEFVTELRQLYESGVYLEKLNTTKRVIVRAVCADLPARAFICRTSYHNSYSCCHRCTLKGKYFRERVCYPGVVFRKRMRHIKHKKTGEHSALCSLPYLSMIHDFPLDYMHSILLGVMKKLLLIWFTTPFLKSSKWKKEKVEKMYCDFSKRIPSEFSRKCRSFKDLKFWKATELRLFLLYTGPVAMQKFLLLIHYNHFMTLRDASTILLSQNLMNYVSEARTLMRRFVRDFQFLYGSHRISINVHSLLHITDDYERFGNLDSVSCFPFENYLSQLKKRVRQFKSPLQSVVRWYQPFTNRKQWKTVITPNSPADGFVLMEDGNLVKITSMKEHVVEGRYFLRKIPFHDRNFPEGNVLCSFKTNGKLSKFKYAWNRQDIVRKYIILQENAQLSVAFPLLHT